MTENGDMSDKPSQDSTSIRWSNEGPKRNVAPVTIITDKGETQLPLITWGRKRELPANQRALSEIDFEPVLEALCPDVPHEFLLQAKLVSKYITELDRGDVSSMRAKKFADQLKRTAFINLVYENRKGIDPSQALPAWLQGGRRKGISADTRNTIATEFAKWIAADGYTSYKTPNGIYYRLGTTQSTTISPQEFKMYVEREALGESFTTGKMKEIIEDLSLEDMQPDEMKLADGSSLVLYYQNQQTPESVEAAFTSHNVLYRGPAQDVFEVIFDNSGTPVVKFADISNDTALGNRSPVKYELSHYDPENFFKNYLQLCLFAGKDPSEPYKTSFVYTTGEIKPTDIQMQQAQDVAQYPILYVPNRYTAQEELWKK